jgi:phage/plasmid primase-like uncharacterized protein
MPDYQAQEEARKQFGEVLADAGLLLKGLPIMDGRLHHVPTRGAKTKGDNAGVYVGLLDGVPGGWFKNYRTDDEQRWHAMGIHDTRSPAEIQKAKEEAERFREEEERKRLEKEERIAVWAQRKWDRCQAATSHPYLKRKRIEPHGLRVDNRNRLLVPMRDLDGKLWSLQSISENGEKHYTAGGRKQGLHAFVGTYDPSKPLVFAEGFATAASIHQATGLPVAVTFDSGNLKLVADNYRGHNATQALLFAADNDHHLPLKQSASGRPLRNVGQEKAEEAARAVNGSVLLPAFDPGNPGSDWNDYAAQHGLAAVREAFAGFPLSSQPSTERLSDKQEVFMSEQERTIAAAAAETGGGLAGDAGAQQARKNPHRKAGVIDAQPSSRSAAIAEASGEHKPLERLTRQDVGRALQSGASLAQKDLSGLDLSNLKFDGINLAGSNLSGTRNINTTYESSRLDGANFSDAVFRNSTIEHVFAVNSRWDRAQFDQTSIVFSNFGNASFRDAAFRDMALTRDRDERSQKQAQDGKEGEDNVRVADPERKPRSAGWGEVAARAGTFLHDIGKALKDVSAQVYHKVRDWWTQPLQLAPEIDRNPVAAWTAQAPPVYTSYEQPQAWAPQQAERAQTQAYADTSVQSRAKPEALGSYVTGEQRGQESPPPNRNTETKANGTQGQRVVSTHVSADPERVQPAIIARNNFQFADLTGARFESIRVQDNDFRHAVLTNAYFPAELHHSNKITREEAAADGQKVSVEALGKGATEPIRSAKTEAEQEEDRRALVETIRRDIETREEKIRDGDSGLYRDTDALHLAKEMLRQVDVKAERIDLTTAYNAVDQATAEDRHIRAYNALNPLIAEAYAKGIPVDRGSASVERAQAITDEAARIHEDVNATKNVQDQKELVGETKNLEAESISLPTEGEAKENELRSELDREGITPLTAMEQDHFDALLSVGVFDLGKPAEWRKEMDQKISDRFAALSSDSAANGKDQHALWFEAARQVQQGEKLDQQGRDRAVQDSGREIEDGTRTQKHEFRRTVALAR